MRRSRAELIHEDARAGIAFDVFEEESGAAGLAGAAVPDFETRSVISAISRRGETSSRMRRSSPDLSRSLIQSLRSSQGRVVAPV